MGRLPQPGIYLSKKDRFDRRGNKIVEQTNNETNNYAQPQPAPQQAAAPQQPPMPQMAPQGGRDAMVAQNIQFNLERRRKAQEYSTALQQNQAAKIAAAKAAGYQGANTGGVSQFIQNAGNPQLTQQAAQLDQATANNMVMPDWQNQQAAIAANQNNAAAIPVYAKAQADVGAGELAKGNAALTQATGNVADQVGTLQSRNSLTASEAAQNTATAGYKNAETNFLTTQGGKVAQPGMVMPASMTATPYPPQPKTPFTPKDQAETNKLIAETDAIKNGVDPATKAKISAAQAIVGPASGADENQKKAAFDYLSSFLKQGGGAPSAPAALTQPPPTGPAPRGPISQVDLEHTAQKHGITVDEVKQRLGIQ